MSPHVADQELDSDRAARLLGVVASSAALAKQDTRLSGDSVAVVLGDVGAPRTPLEAAIRGGRFVEAHRLLETGAEASEADAEFVRRVHAQYERGAEALRRDACGDLRVNGRVKDRGLEWGFDVRGSSIYARTVTPFEGVSFKSVVGAYTEVDIQGKEPFQQSAKLLKRRRSSFFGFGASSAERASNRRRSSLLASSAPGFNSDLVWAEELASDCPADTLWHLRTEGQLTRSKGDNILRVTVVDALDEPIGAVLIFAKTPESSELARLPPPAEGHDRSAVDAVISLTPLRDGEGRLTGNFKMERVLTTQPPAALLTLVNWTPAALVRSHVTKALKTEAEEVSLFMRESRVLDRIVTASSRAALYAALEQRYYLAS